MSDLGEKGCTPISLFFLFLKLLQYHFNITSLSFHNLPIIYIRLYFALCWYLVGIKV